MAIDPDVAQLLDAINTRHNELVERVEALEVGEIHLPPEPPPEPPPVVVDLPPQPTGPPELKTRYAAKNGNGQGTTPDRPMSLADGFRWLDGQANAGGYLRLVDPFIDVNGPVYKFSNTADPGGWRVVTTHTEATEIVYTGGSYLQSMFDVSGCSRIAFHGISSDGKAREGGADLTPKGCMYFVTATSAPTPNHHIWVKGGTHRNLDGVFTVYNDHKHPAAIGDFSLIEDLDAFDIAHWGPWGGSAISVLGPVLATVSPDPMFTVAGILHGQIWRNNRFADVYQKHGYNQRITDGNAMILDYWNESDFWGAAGKSDYDRACLIEGNLTAGCGRALSGVYADPKDGIWHRFNTHYLDGSTNTHAKEGHRSIDVVPATLGGFGMYTPNFHSTANVVVLADGRHVTAGQTFDMGNYGTTWKDLWVTLSNRKAHKDDLGVLKDKIGNWSTRQTNVQPLWETGQRLDNVARFRAAEQMTTNAVRSGPDMLGNTSNRVGAIA